MRLITRTPVGSKSPAPGAPVSKQGGFLTLELALALVASLGSLLVAALLVGCAALGITQPLSLDEQIASAYTTQTAVVQAATAAVSSGTLSSTDATHVLTMAQTSRGLLDAARAAEGTGNTAGASSELALATSALTALQAFVNSQVKK